MQAPRTHIILSRIEPEQWTLEGLEASAEALGHALDGAGVADAMTAAKEEVCHDND